MSFKIRYCLVLVLAGIFSLPGKADETSLSVNMDLVETGYEIYQQYCAVCHGENSEGAASWRTPNDLGDMPPPPHGPEGHTWRHSDASLAQMIRFGWRDPFNKTRGLTMPAFQQILDTEEILAVIEYFKSLWTLEQRQFQKQETDK